MKIFQVLPALEQGGVERGTIEVARALTRDGIPNAVVSAGGRLVAELRALGVPHYVLPMGSKNPFVQWRNARALAELAMREGVTLFHVRSRAPAWGVKWASARCGVPWVTTFHGLYGTEPHWLKIPYNRVMVEGVRTICVSDWVRRHVLATYGVEPSRLVLIPRGADTDVFRPDAVSSESAATLKAQLGFPADLPILTLPGRLTRWKGQVEMLQALARMRHKRVGCLFVGSDQGRTAYAAELKRMAATLPAEIKVVFLPHSDEMPRIYAMSTVVVSASSSQPEAFGRVITEAQAMGVVTLGTAHGGACETIRDGETGFLVPPGDVAALAAKLDAILDLSSERRVAIISAALDSVHQNYSTARMCARTLALYRELQDTL